MKAFTEGIHRHLAVRLSTRRFQLLGGVTLVAFATTAAYAITTAPPVATPKWRRLPVDFTLTYTSSPDSPSPEVRVRTLSLLFPSTTEVEASGDALPLGLSPVYDFDPTELALPNPDNSGVLEPVTWLSLPPFVGEPQVGSVLTRTSPSSTNDSAIVLRGTSTFTITAVSASEIEYTGVDTSELVNTSSLRDYAALLTPDPAQVDSTVAELQAWFHDVPLAEYHVAFDRALGSISSISAVWQRLPDSQVHSLSELRSLPSRVELSVTRN